MGFFKVLFFIVTPIGGMTIAAFSLKKELPKACRWFGNYIGLSYIYFKSIIKIMKPQDHLTYQMIDIARKTSQQSQTLRRELKNTIKKAKLQIKQKKEQTFKNFEKDFPILKEEITVNQDKNIQSNQNINQVNKKPISLSGGQMLIIMERRRRELFYDKKKKKDSRKFYEQL